MANETLLLTVPIDVLATLKLSTSELGHRVLLMAAIQFFREKRLSLGKAAALAGIDRLAFMDELAEQGITQFDYDKSMVEEEMAGAAYLGDTES